MDNRLFFFFTLDSNMIQINECFVLKLLYNVFNLYISLGPCPYTRLGNCDLLIKKRIKSMADLFIIVTFHIFIN